MFAGSKLQSVLQSWSTARQDLKTLVVYVYSGSDPEYEDNLRFFLQTAVKVCTGAGINKLQTANCRVHNYLTYEDLISRGTRPKLSQC